MPKKQSKDEKRDLWCNYAIGINSNLFSAALIGLGYLLPGIPAYMGWLGVGMLWGGLWVVLRFIVRGKWSGVKHIGCYFALTAPLFWAITEQKKRNLEEIKKQSYEYMVERREDVEILDEILTPGSRAEGFKKLIAKIDRMSDERLALVLGNIQRNARYIIGSRENEENQTLFQKVVEKSSARKADDNVGTYDQLLFLLSQIFGVRDRGFSRQLQRTMVDPLKNVLEQIGKPHFGRTRKIVDRIMKDPGEEHEVARLVMKMATDLNVREKCPVFQLILDRSMERAFMFPENFGLEFLYVLDELGEKLFWFDRQSLRELITDAVNDPKRGILTLHAGAYKEMILSKLLQYPRNGLAYRSWVFRGLEGERGRVQVECTLSDEKPCTCEAERLGLGGFLSNNCNKKKGENLRIMLSLTKAKERLEFQGHVEKLRDDGSRTDDCGRNIILEDGEESQVKDLYEYVSKSHSS